MSDADDRPTRPRIGLAMAGGGPEGSVYELGALRALERACAGLDLNALDIYVGVSAGAFLASCLANNVRPGQLCRSILKHDPGEHPFRPEIFFRPAVGEAARGALRLPGLLLDAFRDYASRPRDLSLAESLARLARALPVGLFDNEPLRRYLEGIFSRKGRTNDFRELERRLVIVATDLDSGQAVRFGEAGTDHVPISRAVQASTALPGLYPPVLIDDRHYVDGILLKTLHASVALDAGMDLVLCINPVVPVDTASSVEQGVMRRGRLIHRGLPTVLSQTLRTLVHSRLTVGLAAYEPRFPEQDVVLLEPKRDDYRMFFTNIFRFSSRRAVCEHAYRATLRDLAARRNELAPVLARHGLRLRDEILDDPEPDLWTDLGFGADGAAAATAKLDRALTRLEGLLERSGR